MFKKSLILSSLLTLTACQQLPVGETVYTPKPPIIVDDDNDGVSNDMDKCPYTPEEERSWVYDEGCTMPNYERPLLNMEMRVYYKQNYFYPNKQYFSEIQKVAEKMQESPNSFINIEGHASKAEKDPKKLSHARAVIIAQILKEKYGIDENRIAIHSYADERPIADNNSSESRAVNQRVFAIIYSSKSNYLISQRKT